MEWLQVITDAYEKGKLDGELGVRSDLSLFVKDAAASFLGKPLEQAAKYVPDASIVQLADGRFGVFCARHDRRGCRMVRISASLGVEVRASETLTVWAYPQALAYKVVWALTV